MSGISDRDPADGHRFARSEMSLQVYDSINAYFATFPEARRMEHSSPCSDEYFVLHSATDDVSIWADEAIISNAQRVTSRTSQDGIRHDDAIAANRYRSTFGDKLGSVHDAAAWAYGDVAADQSIRRDPSRRIDLWRISVVIDQHVTLPPWIKKHLTSQITGRNKA